MIRTLPVLAFVTGIGGCIVSFVAPAQVGGVTFVVYINPGLFATDGVVSVDLWNASQLATLEQNARCAQGTAGVPIQCPPGVTYREVVPERVRIPVSSVTTSFEVTPKEIGPGETFRIHLSGPNRDRCNLSSADLVRTAQQGRMEIRDLQWQTTLRGCLAPP